MKSLIALFKHRKEIVAFIAHAEDLRAELLTVNEYIDSLCAAQTRGLDHIGEERRSAALALSVASGMRGVRLIECEVARARLAALDQKIFGYQQEKKEITQDWGVK